MTRNILILVFLISFIVFLLTIIYAGPTRNKPSFSNFGVLNLKNIPFINREARPTFSPNEVERLNLQQDLQAEIDASRLSDNVSIYYKNFYGGYEVFINADRDWNPASIVKAFVAVEAFRQRREKLINFDSRVTIRKENVVPNELESKIYQPLREGVRANIRELVAAMIAQSDNTAYNTLVDLLDRRNITNELRRLGLTDTVVGEKLSLDDEQRTIDLTVLGYQSNRTTAHDVGRLFDLLYQNQIPDSEKILTLFKKQEINDMIPALLPKNIDIAHKTGRLPPYFHDVGIIFKPNDPFILVAFTNHNESGIIARLSKISYFKTRDVLGIYTTTLYEKIMEWLKRGLH